MGDGDITRRTFGEMLSTVALITHSFSFCIVNLKSPSCSSNSFLEGRFQSPLATITNLWRFGKGPERRL